jgi:hypothetical protein
MDKKNKIKPTAQQWLKNHSCPAGQQRFLAWPLGHIRSYAMKKLLGLYILIAMQLFSFALLIIEDNRNQYYEHVKQFAFILYEYHSIPVLEYFPLVASSIILLALVIYIAKRRFWDDIITFLLIASAFHILETAPFQLSLQISVIKIDFIPLLILVVHLSSNIELRMKYLQVLKLNEHPTEEEIDNNDSLVQFYRRKYEALSMEELNEMANSQELNYAARKAVILILNERNK